MGDHLARIATGEPRFSRRSTDLVYFDSASLLNSTTFDVLDGRKTFGLLCRYEIKHAWQKLHDRYLINSARCLLASILELRRHPAASLRLYCPLPDCSRWSDCSHVQNWHRCRRRYSRHGSYSACDLDRPRLWQSSIAAFPRPTLINE